MIDYPRWMFHREHEMKLVQNEEEEAALGPGWSRDIRVQVPSEEKPARRVPEQEYPPEPEAPDFDEEEKPDEQPQERARPTTAAPSARKKRKA